MIPVSGSARRRLPSFIDGFTNYTEQTGSPLLFRKWAAISCVAGALERRVWFKMRGKFTFPNLYVCLIGPPGVGKTVVTSVVGDLWRSLEAHHVSPNSLTAASMLDALNGAKRNIIRPGLIPPYEDFNSLKVLAGEMGSLLPAYDAEFMNYLTDLFDNNPFHQTRRTKDLSVKLQKPQLNILTGTTPSYMGGFMPQAAWEQGFISRVMLIYAGAGTQYDPFEAPPDDEIMRSALYHDMALIGHDEFYGEFTIEQDAMDALRHAWKNRIPPEPDHPKLSSYLPRRLIMLVKLCMVAAASRGKGLRIELDDYQLALDWLLEAEANMPDIFRAMVGGGDSAAIQDCWYYCMQTFAKEGRPVRESRIVGFLNEKVPSHAVMRVIEMMVKSDLLTVSIDQTGQNAYTPKAKVGGGNPG